MNRRQKQAQPGWQVNPNIGSMTMRRVAFWLFAVLAALNAFTGIWLMLFHAPRDDILISTLPFLIGALLFGLAAKGWARREPDGDLRARYDAVSNVAALAVADATKYRNALEEIANGSCDAERAMHVARDAVKGAVLEKK
jgi:hypothetical protein